MKKLALFSAFFLILLIVSYFIEQSPSIWTLVINIVLPFYFLALCCSLLWHCRILWKDRFRNATKNWLLLFTISVITFTTACFFGMIRLDRIYGKDILVAGREGAANCFTTFKLKNTQNFTTESFCFGREWNRGRYFISGDTIHFAGTSQQANGYLFGLIEMQSKTFPGRDLLWLFRSRDDKDPYFLFISMNELPK